MSESNQNNEIDYQNYQEIVDKPKNPEENQVQPEQNPQNIGQTNNIANQPLINSGPSQENNNNQQNQYQNYANYVPQPNQNIYQPPPQPNLYNPAPDQQISNPGAQPGFAQPNMQPMMQPMAHQIQPVVIGNANPPMYIQPPLVVDNGIRRRNNIIAFVIIVVSVIIIFLCFIFVYI